MNKIGQWYWHVNAFCACTLDAVDGEYVTVTFQDFQHGACTVKSPLIGQTCETFGNCLVPLEQAPCYVSDLLQDWCDAIEMDKTKTMSVMVWDGFRAGIVFSGSRAECLNWIQNHPKLTMTKEEGKYFLVE